MQLTTSHWWIYIPALLLLAGLTVYKRWLTVGGAIAAVCTGLVLLFTGGPTAFVAPALFLVSGSLLGKLNRPSEAEKHGRDALQVAANGLVGLVCITFHHVMGDAVWLLAFCTSFCVSMADSWSSEIGVYCKGRTFDILNLRRCPPGMSGGVSWQGSLGGLAGAAVLATVVGFTYHFTIYQCMVIAGAGFAGMLADSLLGSLLQRKYRLPDGALAEDPAPGAVLTKGFAWCDNNVVNVLSNLLTTGIAIGISSLVS